MIPTAEEFLSNHSTYEGFETESIKKDVVKTMIEFAQMHVEAALEKASCNAVLTSYNNNANKPGTSEFTTMIVNDIEWRPCLKSILNAYSLTLIK